jgi:hypothetical protein
VKYSGNITGGALLVRESRIVARLLLENPDRDAARDRLLAENLFQNNSPRTTKTYYRLILPRLGNLTPEMLRLVAEGTEELARLTLFAAILRTFDLVADFVEDVLVTKVQSFEPTLLRTDWSRFLEERTTVDPAIHDWSESSRKKMAQVVFLMLSQAGYLEDTRSLKILFPAVPSELESALEAARDERTPRLLRLGRS